MESEPTLVDLLDRVLDKGVVIQADVVISVAGIPLIGLNLRAALAGMETMINHGLMRSWDEQIRAEALREGSAPLRKAPVPNISRQGQGAGRRPAPSKAVLVVA